jgi:peptidoglycan/xylan/chitin deacetylase (PgdA/CDA1 family)
MPSFRITVLKLLEASGTFRLLRDSKWRSRRLLILCYHGFSLADEHLWNSNLYAPAEHLERRLSRLRKDNFAVLPLGEALRRLYEGTLPARAVALTVDDGNYDFLAAGYPVFRRAGVPLTLYASTYYVLDQRPVFNVAADYLLWRGRCLGRREVSISGIPDVLPLAGPRDPGSSAARLRALAEREHWSADDKHRLLERLAAALGVDWGQFLASRLFTLMTTAELAGLDPGIVDVQLHTHRHRMPNEREEMLREIRDNREVLIRSGRRPEDLVHFCYPSGVHAPQHLTWLREAGVASATTTVPGIASPHSEPLRLPRFIDTASTSDLEFDAWCAGVRAVLRRPAWTMRPASPA